MDEALLIAQVKSEDPSAFQELVNRYGYRVYNVALGFLHDNDDAQDLSQEVFIEVFQSISGFKGKSRLSTWIYRITVQKSLEFIRKRNRKKRSGVIISLFGKEDLISTSASAPFYHPGVKLENKERSAVLFKALTRLPEHQRTAFTLHKIEDLSYNEIAEIMKVSLSSVESLMFRAKQNLRKLLSDYYDKNER